jgi:hypothetical protein
MRVRGAVAITAGLLVLAFPSQASAQETLDANCPGPREFSFASMGGGTSRFAQSFTAGITGGITSAQIDVTKQGTAGDYRLDINEADAAGVPTNTILASATIPDTAVPAGNSIITGSFDSPAQVSAGQEYALIVTRPTSSGLAVGTRTGNDCSGRLFFSNTQTGPFGPVGPGDTNDLVFAVFVRESDPPETAITKSPRQKTRKRRATFEFTSDEPDSSFQCAVDGQVLKVACTSPYTIKVKRGKHTFRVQATDAAGNVDGTPANDDWKVKRKRRRN